MYPKNKKIDIVVGIPSYNEADNIEFVAKQIDLGLRKYFPKLKSAIINVDNDSPDNTKDEFLKAKTKTPKIYISTPKGIRGKGNNFYNLFKAAKKLQAKTIIVVDADLKSITPEWISILGKPILNGYDYVTPLYNRHEYDGSITNHLCYPLMYGLLNRAIRQPIAGDFSFSSNLMEYWINKTWYQTTKHYGVDIFMTLGAILGKFKTCQVNLGAKIHKPSAPKLGQMFSQVVGTLFKELSANKDGWQQKKIIKETVFGKEKYQAPQNLSIDYKGIKATALYEFKINQNILKQALSEENYEKIHTMYSQQKLDITGNLWSKIIYDLLYAFDTTDLNSNLIEAMKSLYFGRVVSFIKQSLDLDYKESEALLQKQAESFLKNRSYLLKKYKIS
ncbi:MAG: glycosyltransferase [Patescibacteria group bacterium]|nr:glycosyltransferase [Patescibacteria group bacterium]MBU1160793.1 glycosyltransferase [Patescibacteria group bacterium]MBU1987154.1 glycosyltransferase [Patescibacteria group bacterium]MBU2474722.1 glycosyltransferase [Patescibacteria group bacterium]